MKLPKELTTVTNLSKSVALLMFISLPIVAFLFGMRYQTMLVEKSIPNPPIQSITPTAEPIACTSEARECPDGSYVGRGGPNCDFEECPKDPQNKVFCGGIAGKTCPSGSYCKYDGTYPDAGGTCIKTVESRPTGTRYICPKTEYVDCMPGPGTPRPECAMDFLEWAQNNCPGFKGAAY